MANAAFEDRSLLHRCEEGGPPSERTDDVDQNRAGVKRLDNVAISSTIGDGLRHEWRVDGAHHDDRHRRMITLGICHQREPALFGHDEVTKEEVKGYFLK